MMVLNLIAAILVAGLLVAVGWGVRRILRDVSFMADIVERNMAEPEGPAPQPLDDGEDENDTKPLGFGVRLRERS